MFELEYLYEQLKSQTVEQNYIDVLDAVTEGYYDTVEISKSISETVEMIEEVSKQGKLNLLDKFKSNIATAEKVIEKDKDAALKCKPYGLEYKDFKTFMSDDQIKALHKKAITYLNKFNLDKASDEELKQYILDSQNNVQYKEISKIFGDGKERFSSTDIIVIKKENKELTKNDISNAVKYLQSYTKILKDIQKESNENSTEYTNYVRKSGIPSGKTSSEKLKQNALNHKKALVAIADQTYYAFMIQKMKMEFSQAKRIVVKAANYNPRNLKESYVIQDYIDAMYDFNENN